MFPFPSPLEFLRAFIFAFLAGASTGVAAITLGLALLYSLKRSFRFGFKA